MGAQYLTNYAASNDDFRTLLRAKHKLAAFDISRVHQAERYHAKDGQQSPQVHEICPDTLGMRAVVEQLLQGTVCYVYVARTA